MKKILCVGLTFALLFCFAACKRGQEVNTGITGPTMTVNVTDGNGNPVTVVVTDKNGGKVTDVDYYGETYIVTQAVTQVVPYEKTTADPSMPMIEEGDFIDEGTTSSASPVSPTASGTAASQAKTTTLRDSATHAPTTKKAAATTVKGQTTVKATTAQSGGSVAPGTVKPTAATTTKVNVTTTAAPTTVPVTDPSVKKEDAKAVVNLVEVSDGEITNCVINSQFDKLDEALADYVKIVEKNYSTINGNAAYKKIVSSSDLEVWKAKVLEAQRLYDAFYKIYSDKNASSDEWSRAYTTYQKAFIEHRQAGFAMTDAANAYL